MLETIALIFIVVLIFILISVVAYIVYDYINYKQSVDNTIALSTKYINTNTASNTSNIINYTTVLDNKINNVSTTLTNTIGNNYNYTSNLTSNLMYFDNALNRFFHFNENNSPINKRLFEYNFTGINPNLDILNRVNALSGMNIMTTDKYLSSNNFRICDNSTNVGKNCINLNVATNGQFHITPENDVKSLIINNVGNYPMAKFDYNMNDIYLGGDGSEARPGSMKINGNDLYIKDIKLISGNNDNIGNITETTLFNKDFVNNINKNILCDYFIKQIITTDTSSPPVTTTTYTLKINLMPYVDIPSNTNINIQIPELSTATIPNNKIQVIDNITVSTSPKNIDITYNYQRGQKSLILNPNNILSVIFCKNNTIEITGITNTTDISTVGNKITMATAISPTSTTTPTRIVSTPITRSTATNAYITTIPSTSTTP